MKTNTKVLIGLIILMVGFLTIGSVTRIGNWGNFSLGVNTPRVVSSVSPWIDVTAFDTVYANGITNNTNAIQAIINAQTADSTGNQTYILIPPKVKYLFSALTNISNGTVIMDFSGNETGKGVFFIYANGTSVDGGGSYRDNNFVFASSYHPGVVVRNYNTTHNAGDSYGSFVSQISPTQNIMQMTDEKDASGKVRHALYTYVDGDGNNIGQTTLSVKYATGERIEKLGFSDPMSYVNFSGQETSKITSNGTYRVRALALYSSSAAEGKNLVGQCELLTTNTCNIVFTYPEPDTNYDIFLSAYNGGGGAWIPAMSSSARATTGFTITTNPASPDNGGHYVMYLIVRSV